MLRNEKTCSDEDVGVAYREVLENCLEDSPKKRSVIDGILSWTMDKKCVPCVRQWSDALELFHIVRFVGSRIMTKRYVFSKFLRFLVKSVGDIPMPFSEVSAPVKQRVMGMVEPIDVAGLTTPETLDRDLSILWYSNIYDLMPNYLMPALGLVPQDPVLPGDIYEIIRVYPYNMRYKMYYMWHRVMTVDPVLPHLSAARDCALADVKFIMKRLSTDNIRMFSRMFSKVTNSMPIVTMSDILDQLNSYDNLVAPVVDAFKYASPLSLDVYGYLAILRMTSNPNTLQSNANITAAFVSAYSRCDVLSILHYVMLQARAGHAQHTILLRQMISVMAGVEYTEVVTDPQLEAQGGGKLLRSLAGSYLTIAQAKGKSMDRLRTAIVKDSLALPLFLSLYRIRNQILFGRFNGVSVYSAILSDDVLKPMCEMYDKVHDTLFQLCDFLEHIVYVKDQEYVS